MQTKTERQINKFIKKIEPMLNNGNFFYCIECEKIVPETVYESICFNKKHILFFRDNKFIIKELIYKHIIK